MSEAHNDLTGKDGQLVSLWKQEQASWRQREKLLSQTFWYLFLHLCVYCVHAEVRGQLLSGYVTTAFTTEPSLVPRLS